MSYAHLILIIVSAPFCIVFQCTTYRCSWATFLGVMHTLYRYLCLAIPSHDFSVHTACSFIHQYPCSAFSSRSHVFATVYSRSFAIPAFHHDPYNATIDDHSRISFNHSGEKTMIVRGIAITVIKIID